MVVQRKDAIFAALMAAHVAEMQPIEARGIAALADPARPVRESVARSMNESLAVHLRDPARLAALDRELAGRLPHDLERDAEAARAAIAACLGARPDVAASWPRERAFLLLHTLEAVGRALVHGVGPDLDRERVVELTAAILDAMLRAEPPAPRDGRGAHGAGRRDRSGRSTRRPTVPDQALLP